MQITPLSAALGAEISGLDLRQNLSEVEVAGVLDAWHEHLVLVFRGQELDDDDQIRFTRHFGEVGVPRRPTSNIARTAEERHPAIMLVSNIREEGKPMGQPHDGQMWFHSDMCYSAIPHKATMLYGIEIPATGGNTCFANMYDACDRLPDDIRARLEDRKALQVHEYRRVERPRRDADSDGALHYAHPVFLTHPATGKRALFVNRLMTACIEGLPDDESDRLLDVLFEISEAPDNLYEHVWSPGDLVMWDNRCTVHGRTDYPDTERRLLRRTTVVGEAPV